MLISKYSAYHRTSDLRWIIILDLFLITLWRLISKFAENALSSSTDIGQHSYSTVAKLLLQIMNRCIAPYHKLHLLNCLENLIDSCNELIIMKKPLTREHPQLSNRFLLVTIAIRVVSMSSEKVSLSLIFWLSLVELEAFYWIYGLWV